MTYDALKAGSIDGTDVEPHDRAIVRALDARYKPNHKVKGIPENTIFISRLNRKTSERTLKHVRTLPRSYSSTATKSTEI